MKRMRVVMIPLVVILQMALLTWAWQHDIRRYWELNLKRLKAPSCGLAIVLKVDGVPYREQAVVCQGPDGMVVVGR